MSAITPRPEADAGRPIQVVTGCLLDQHHRLLLVRKQSTVRFILPGGKPERDESPLATLAREWREELGVGLTDSPRLLGEFEADAANEAGRRVLARVYRVTAIEPADLDCAAERRP